MLVVALAVLWCTLGCALAVLLGRAVNVADARARAQDLQAVIADLAEPLP